MSLLAATTFHGAFVSRTHAEPIAIVPPNRDNAVDFNTDILPILKTNCLACHSESEAQGELVLETAASARAGGSSGPSVVPGDSAAGYLLKLASHVDDPVMPPEDNEVGANSLTPEQLGLLKLWIDQGAKDGQGPATSTVAFRPLPNHVDSILAAAISGDGRLAVCSRGNRLFVYETIGGDLIQELIDSELRLSGQPTNTAHLDLVQSVAVDPDGKWIASGGFRNIKLWQRQENAERLRIDLTETPTCLDVTVDSRQAAVGFANGSIQRIDLESGSVTHTWNGHAGSVNAVAFTSDNRLASVAADNSLRIWSNDSAEPLHRLALSSPAKVLTCVANRIVSGHDDHAIRVWTVAESGEPTMEREITGHGGAVTSISAIANRPNEIVSGSADGTARTWKLDSGEQLRSYNQDSAVLSVCVHPDGNRLLSTGENQLARLWNNDDGQKLVEIKGDFRITDELGSVDRALNLVRAETEATKARITELETQQKSRAEESQKATDAVPAVEKELADKTMAASDAATAKAFAEQSVADATAALADVEKLVAQFQTQQMAATETGNQLNTGLQSTQNANASPSDSVKGKLNEVTQLVEQLRNQQNESYSQLVTRTNELRDATSQQIAEAKKKVEESTKQVTDADNAVKEAQRKLDQSKLNVDQRQQDLTRLNEELATVQSELALQESRIASTEQDRSAVAQRETESAARHVASRFSLTHNQLAIATQTGAIYLYDAQTGAAKDRFPGHSGKPIAVEWAVDAVVSIGNDKQLIVWNTKHNWTLARTLGGIDQPGPLSDRVLALDFTSDGSLLAAGSGEPSRSGVVSIWNTADGSLVRSIDDAHSDTVYAVEFSPDDQQLASCAADRMAKIFAVADGVLVRGFEGHTHHVLDVAWQANGKSLATAGADKVIKIWNADTGEQRRTISGIEKEVTAVAFSGISPNIISASGDTNIRIHNGGDGNIIRSMNGGGDFVYATAVSDDGRRVISGGVKSVLQIWNADDGALIKALEPPSVQ